MGPSVTGGLVLKAREPSGGQSGEVHEGREGFGSLGWEVAIGLLCGLWSKVQGFSVSQKQFFFFIQIGILLVLEESNWWPGCSFPDGLPT